MARITVELDDSKAVLLQKKAREFGLLFDPFVTASIDDLIGQPEPEFEAAMQTQLSQGR